MCVFGAVYKHFKSNAVILENLTDSLFPLLSLVAGVALAIAVQNATQPSESTAVVCLGYLVFHLVWTNAVPQRANGGQGSIRTVTFAPVELWLLPVLYLTTSPQTIQGRGMDESEADLARYYTQQVQNNARATKQKTSVAR